MTRQNIRKAIIVFSFLLFPITLYYFSPYLIIQGAIEGIITGSFIVFLTMLVTSIFFGRLFCGWICPAGGLQECAIIVKDKRAKGGKLNRIKYFIWAFWIIIIISISISVGGFKMVDFFYQTTYGISVANPYAFIIYYGVVFLIFGLSLFAGKRSFCHYVCWMAPFMVIGLRIRGILKIPYFHLAVEKEKCIDCKQCTKKCPMSLDVNENVKIDKIQNDECILCLECVDACPKKVISLKFDK